MMSPGVTSARAAAICCGETNDGRGAGEAGPPAAISIVRGSGFHAA
jgi:hypothetical protein